MYFGVSFIQVLVDIFFGLAEIILGLRVIFRLFAANGFNSFVNWIYQTSDTLISPFRGIFPSVNFSHGYVLDISALFAMLIYAVVGYLILALLGLVPTPGPRSYRVRTTTRRTSR